jgi:hypothetical protein
LVADKYITEDERQQAISDYRQWMEGAQVMKLYLRAITGYRR